MYGKSIAILKDRANNIYKGGEEEEDSKRSIGIIQPTMRFKPRSEMERVLETINSYSYGKIDENLMRKIQKNAYSKNPSQTHTKRDLMNRSDENFPDKKSWKTYTYRIKSTENSCNENNKIDVKKLFKKYHYKTHFKAATDLANFNSIRLIT
jgi:hypothetical protein